MKSTEFPIGGFQSDYENSEYVVVGVPLDETASFREGCVEGPNAIRQFANNIETVNPFNEKDISESYIHDAGDIVDNKLIELEKFASKVRNDGKKLLVLGGEHSILSSIGKIYKDHVFVVFDAHADLRDSYDNNPYSHACAVRRLLDYISPDQLILLGIRAVSTEERLYIKQNEIKVFWGHQWDSTKIEDIMSLINQKLEKYKGLYISIDMDGFDPAFVPGVGNPEALGLSPREFFNLLDKLPEISAADINELNPKLDPAGSSSTVAARLALTILTR